MCCWNTSPRRRTSPDWSTPSWTTSRREVRRAEFYPNGLCFACGGEYGREEALSPVPYPEDLRSLSRPGEVAARAIPAQVFQTVWGQAQERPDGFFGMFA